MTIPYEKTLTTLIDRAAEAYDEVQTPAGLATLDDLTRGLWAELTAEPDALGPYTAAWGRITRARHAAHDRIEAQA